MYSVSVIVSSVTKEMCNVAAEKLGDKTNSFTENIVQEAINILPVMEHHESCSPVATDVDYTSVSNDNYCLMDSNRLIIPDLGLDQNICDNFFLIRKIVLMLKLEDMMPVLTLIQMYSQVLEMKIRSRLVV